MSLQVLPDALHAVGRTPLIKLNRIPQQNGLKCNIRKFRQLF